MLDSRGVPREAYDAIVASGELALRHIAEQGYKRIFCIGPADRDALTFSRLEADQVALEEADAILCTGLNDDRSETADDYWPLLEKARARNLPFVCANPDLVVDVGGRQYLCAGAIADLYERMDGAVFWAGKPHANAYAAARAAAEGLRGSPVPLERIIAIGDSLRTDLKGAEAAGIAAIFVASGIHRDETMNAGDAVGRQVAPAVCPAGPRRHRGDGTARLVAARGVAVPPDCVYTFPAVTVGGDDHALRFRFIGSCRLRGVDGCHRRRHGLCLLARPAQGRRPVVHVGSLSFRFRLGPQQGCRASRRGALVGRLHQLRVRLGMGPLVGRAQQVGALHEGRQRLERRRRRTALPRLSACLGPQNGRPFTMRLP